MSLSQCLVAVGINLTKDGIINMECFVLFIGTLDETGNVIRDVIVGVYTTRYNAMQAELILRDKYRLEKNRYYHIINLLMDKMP